MEDDRFAKAPGGPPVTPKNKNDDDDDIAAMSPEVRALAELAFEHDGEAVKMQYFKAFHKGHESGFGSGFLKGVREGRRQVLAGFEAGANDSEVAAPIRATNQLSGVALALHNIVSTPVRPPAPVAITISDSSCSSPAFVTQRRDISDPFKPEPSAGLVDAAPALLPVLRLGRGGAGADDAPAPSVRSMATDPKFPDIMDELVPSPPPGTYCTPPLIPLPPAPIFAPAVPAMIPTSPVPLPAPGTLYGIPPASAVQPVTPDFDPPRPPAPPYPDMEAHHPRGLAGFGGGGSVRLTENPWRLLVGPISSEAHAAWWPDQGKRYFKSKVQGVMLCQMMRDVQGRSYVAILFENSVYAERAREVFTGYACGGAIMWSWIYKDVEY
ncbi:hypothetical protein MFIFM68171_06539 [Madurella fahalii]|uniref:Uncharacterized protein n=1 Tax=Madurella fahalii TaxID=1157608 RepID=A0ABQ0GEY9_9PEZI